MGIRDALAREMVELAVKTPAAQKFVDAARTHAAPLTAPLEGLLQDAWKAYEQSDWCAAKTLYQTVVERTAASAEYATNNYLSVGRLARANFHLGDEPAARAGFRSFLRADGPASPLKGKVYSEFGEILERGGQPKAAALMRAHSQGILAERPDFRSFKPLIVPRDYKFTAEAVDQVRRFEEKDVIREPLVKGFFDHGEQRYHFQQPSPMMTVVDSTADGALQLALQTSAGHFSNLRAKPAEHLVALSEYTGRLFSTSESAYHGFRDAHAGNRIFLGECLRLQIGKCNQKTMFFKVATDEAGYSGSLYTGYHQDMPHDFPTIRLGSHERIWDTSLGIIGKRFAAHEGSTYTASSWGGRWLR